MVTVERILHGEDLPPICGPKAHPDGHDGGFVPAHGLQTAWVIRPGGAVHCHESSRCAGLGRAGGRS